MTSSTELAQRRLVAEIHLYLFPKGYTALDVQHCLEGKPWNVWVHPEVVHVVSYAIRDVPDIVRYRLAMLSRKMTEDLGD